jgi:hypothetical protein
LEIRRLLEQFLTILKNNKSTNMKTTIFIFAMATMLASASFSQTTTNSTDPNQNRADANNKKNAVGERQNDNNADHATKDKTTHTRPSVEKKNSSAKNASADSGNVKKTNSTASPNVVAKKTGAAATAEKKFAPNVSQGAINNTPTDTTLKKGSGSSPRNMKNKTGKTGNYSNEATKRNSKN